MGVFHSELPDLHGVPRTNAPRPELLPPYAPTPDAEKALGIFFAEQRIRTIYA